VGLCHCRSYLSSSANRRLYSTGCLLDDQQFFIPQTPQSGYVCDISVTSRSGPPSLRPGACLIITHPAEWYPTHLGQEPILTELLGRFMTACRQIPWITKGNIPLWQLKACLNLKVRALPIQPFFFNSLLLQNQPICLQILCPSAFCSIRLPVSSVPCL